MFEILRRAVLRYFGIQEYKICLRIYNNGLEDAGEYQSYFLPEETEKLVDCLNSYSCPIRGYTVKL